jgi:hypothetical protein
MIVGSQLCPACVQAPPAQQSFHHLKFPVNDQAIVLDKNLRLRNTYWELF